MKKLIEEYACNMRYFSYFCSAKQSHFAKYNCGKSRFNSKSGAQAPKVVTDLANSYSLNRLLPFMFKGVFMKEEIWKDVVGYEGVYLVSDMGNVKRVETGNILHGVIKEGYKYVNLSVNGKGRAVAIHRVVGRTFIDNPENKPQINHINGIKTDNRIENLEWVTAKENKIHAIKIGLANHEHVTGENHYGSKLTKEDVVCVRMMRLDGMTYKKIAEKFKVKPTTIQSVITFRTWKHITRGVVL